MSTGWLWNCAVLKRHEGMRSANKVECHAAYRHYWLGFMAVVGIPPRTLQPIPNAIKSTSDHNGAKCTSPPEHILRSTPSLNHHRRCPTVSEKFIFDPTRKLTCSVSIASSLVQRNTSASLDQGNSRCFRRRQRVPSLVRQRLAL